MVTELRVFPFEGVEIRAEDGAKPMIRGHAAVFNKKSENLGGFREVILPGAFKKVLEDDVRALWNHNADNVLGRSKAGTLRLSEDARGLAVEIDPPDSAIRELEAIRRGDVDQMSFAFQVDEDREEKHGGEILRTIVSVKRLLDVSPVTYPAYRQTDVAVRSILAGAGLEYDALGRVLSRADRKLPMESEDLALLKRSIDVLSGMVPSDPEPEVGLTLEAALRRLRLAEAA